MAGPFTLSLGVGYTLTGIVVEGSGAPLDGVQMLAGKMTEPNEKPEDPKFLARTDRQGKFSLPHRSRQDPIVLICVKPGYTPLEVSSPDPSTVADGQTMDLGTLVLRPGATIRGAVRGLAATEDCSVTLEGIRFMPPAPLDPDGNFILEHVSPGKHRFQILRRGEVLSKKRGFELEGDSEFEVGEGDTRMVELKLMKRD